MTKWKTRIGAVVAPVAALWVAACGQKDTPAAGAAGNAGAPAPAYGEASGNVPAAAAAPADGRRTLLILGTSLTAGLGLDPADAYPALLEAKADSAGLAWTVLNAGLSGETSAGALRRADWVLEGPGDIVMIETGANDGLRGVEVDSTRANIRALLARVKTRKPQATVLLVQMEAPPNMGQSYTRAFRAIYPDLAKEAGVTLVPFLLDGVAGVASLNQADGIHPNEEGARRVAANVWKTVAPLLSR